MPGPKVIELSNEFRERLKQQERQASIAMARYYGESWRRLQSDITALQAEQAAAVARGETLSPGQLFRTQRMQAIQRQVEQEMARFSAFAADTTEGQQRLGLASGSRDAGALVQASLPNVPGGATVAVNFAQMPREAVEQMVGFVQDGTPLRALIEKAMGEAAQAFSQTLVDGITAGWNPRKLANELRSAYGMGLTRAMRIARTEQMRAYRAATLNMYRENSDIVTGWERQCSADDRCCLACLMKDGERYELEQEMDDHVSGRCACLPLCKSWRELGLDVDEPDFQREMGRDWFERQDEATQRRIMRDAVYDAWQDGRIRLEDIPKLVENETWGNSWQVKSQQELGISGESNEQAATEDGE